MLANSRPVTSAVDAAIAPIRLKAAIVMRSMINIAITSTEVAMVIGVVFLLFINRALWKEISTVSPGSKVAICAGNFANCVNSRESPEIL